MSKNIIAFRIARWQPVFPLSLLRGGGEAGKVMFSSTFNLRLDRSGCKARQRLNMQIKLAVALRGSRV